MAGITQATWGVKPSERPPSAPGGQGDAIQKAIDEVMMPSSPYHTLVFPVGTYLTHDLHISNHSGAKPLTIFLEEGVLLQRDGSHIGPLTSPGFITIFNSSNVTLRGLGTLDALNGGQGLCPSPPPPPPSPDSYQFLQYLLESIFATRGA